MIDRELAVSILKRLLRRGGEYGEVYMESREGFSAQMEDGKIEKVTEGFERGVGLRLLYRGKTFYGYTNSLRQDELLELADQVSRAASDETNLTIALERSTTEVIHPYRLMPQDVEVTRKIGVIKEMNRTARSYSPKIRQVLAVYRESLQTVVVANSEGQWAEDRRLHTLALIQVVAAEDGIVQTGYEPVGGLMGFEIFEGDPPEAIALRAAERAVMMLRAPKAPAGRMPVVISSEAGGTMIHEAIGHGLEADLALQGLSVYSEKIGSEVASKVITVVDDATLQNKRGSFRFDDEGTPAQRTVLVDRGILVNYMYDRLYALKDGKTPTGNGRRQSYRHRPIPRMTNTLIEPGTHSPEEILQSAHSGLFVKKMGGGQVNTINGDFVFEVQEGYLIRNGHLDHPVRGATLTGNGPQILRTIEMVGSDLGFSIGTCGKDGQGVPVSDAMPTILVPEMVVGGEAD